MEEVSVQMGVSPPTSDDLQEILQELDEDFDGVIDKGEFFSLTMMVLSQLLTSETELQTKINKEIKEELKAKRAIKNKKKR